MVRPERLELLNQFPKLAAGLRVEASGGLIEKKKIGIADERAGEREALFLAARKIADAGSLFFIELHEGDGFGCVRALIKKTAEQLERFEDSQLFGELRILQLNAEALAELLRVGIPTHAEQFDVAGIGGGQSFADFDGGCFACAVRPKKAEAFAGAHLEVEAVDGDHVLVGLAETSDTKGWFGYDRRHESSIASEKGTCNLRIGRPPRYSHFTKSSRDGVHGVNLAAVLERKGTR